MAGRSKTIDTWRQMKPASLRRLALAVFLMFGVLGPLMILMQSSLTTYSARFVIVQTIACGGLAASIILLARRRWYYIILLVVFWTAVITMNSGELSFGYFDNEGFRVRLGNEAIESPLHSSDRALMLSPKELNDIYIQKEFLGFLAIGLLAIGYAFFIKVIRNEVGQRARFETEVTIARDIQQSLLPPPRFQNSWCAIAGQTIPATEVGGDYFDMVQLSDRQFAIAIADVTGHGVGAGILSAMTKSALHSQLQHDTSPSRVLANLNKALYQVSDEKTFVTFAYVLVESAPDRVLLATAGHPPVIVRKGSTGVSELYRTVSVALAMKETVVFTEQELAFSRGDSLLLFTDGLLEATNRSGEEFGIERLRKAFDRAEGSPEDICSSLILDARTFSSTEIFHDDVSLVCVKFL